MFLLRCHIKIGPTKWTYNLKNLLGLGKIGHVLMLYPDAHLIQHAHFHLKHESSMDGLVKVERFHQEYRTSIYALTCCKLPDQLNQLLLLLKQHEDRKLVVINSPR